jgi:glycyl-tRNA synthetase
MILSNAYTEEKVPNAEGKLEDRIVLKIPPALAPVQVAVLPLVKKDGLPEVAREIIDSLKMDFYCQYDEKDSIGRRYRRQDAIGTPYCVTTDQQTLEDRTVTLRDRDTMEQIRVGIEELPRILDEKVNMRNLLRTFL